MSMPTEALRQSSAIHARARRMSRRIGGTGARSIRDWTVTRSVGRRRSQASAVSVNTTAPVATTAIAIARNFAKMIVVEVTGLTAANAGKALERAKKSNLPKFPDITVKIMMGMARIIGKMSRGAVRAKGAS